MLRKRNFLSVLACSAMLLAMSNETLAKDVEVKDLHLKLPFSDGETWQTECVYDDTGGCSTHAKYLRGVINKDRYVLDFNHYVYDSNCYVDLTHYSMGFSNFLAQTIQDKLNN